GLRVRPVEAESGAIGGSYSHEFMVLADTGEEGIVSSECGYAANVERAEIKASAKASNVPSTPAAEEISTPGAISVEEVARIVKRPKEDFIKALLLMADEKPVMVLVRGDHELNEAKLLRYLKATWVAKADEATYEKVSG